MMSHYRSVRPNNGLNFGSPGGVSVTGISNSEKLFEGHVSPSRLSPPVQQIQQEQNDESLLLIDIKNTDSNNTPTKHTEEERKTKKMEKPG